MHACQVPGMTEPERAHLDGLMAEIISASQPSLRHLAYDTGDAAIGGSRSRGMVLPWPAARNTDGVPSSSSSVRISPGLEGKFHTAPSSVARTSLESQRAVYMGDQRYPGMPRAKLSQNSRNLDDVQDEGQVGDQAHEYGNNVKRESEAHGGLNEHAEQPALRPLALACLMISLGLSVFLISLDRTIITTAIPDITNEFTSYNDIGWYGSAYLMTACAFQPLYGRIFGLFSLKWSFLIALAIFELGSLICGVAPNSPALIVGRAIAGVGSAGVLTGAFIVIAHAVPLHKRPVYTAAVGLMFGVGAVAGPLLGGVFTTLVTWRWCFYFNLPVGGATFAAMVFLFKPKKTAASKKSFMSRLLELDFIGNAILLSACVMFFLALELADSQVPWDSAEIIGLLTGSGVTAVIFVLWLFWRGEKALIPPRIVGQRTVAASCFIAFFLYAALLVQSYFLPEWYQAIKGDSAVESGVEMISYMVANAVFSLIGGVVVAKTGYFTPIAIIGCAIGTVGCGTLTLLHVDSNSAHLTGYQILTSAGFGLAVQQGFTAVQSVLTTEDMAIGTAVVVACQSLGGAVFVSVGNAILQNELFAAADNGKLPGVDVQAVIDAGASGFRAVVSSADLPQVLVAYNSALSKVFLATVPVTGCAWLASLALEWKNVKQKPTTNAEEDGAWPDSSQLERTETKEI